MIEGQIYKLMPFRKGIEDASGKDKMDYKAIFFEDVTFLAYSSTGNAIVRDDNGRQRLCDPGDLYAN